jgi:two-component sensor histidine kinase/putative methionine-R-sulfoxide reductase with GAF domain
MNRDRLAEILERVSGRVKDHWRRAWEKQLELAQAGGRSVYNPYSDNDGVEGNGSAVAEPAPNQGLNGDGAGSQPAQDGVAAEVPDVVQQLLELPPLRSPVAASAHNVYPQYYDRLVSSVRANDIANFCDFMSVEGNKWALTEVPVDELVGQTLVYAQEIMDAVSSADELQLSTDERREIIHILDGLTRRAVASIMQGYVNGRDRLLIRALASNRPTEESPTLSPIVKGTVMGGFGEQVRRSLDELEALHKVNSAVNSSLDLDSILNLTVQAVAEVMNVDVCAVYVFDKDQDENSTMVLRAAKGLNPRSIGQVRVRVGEGVTGASAKEGKPISVYDIWADSRFRYVEALQEDASRSMLSVPVILFTREKLVGVINVQSRTYRNWNNEEIRFLEMVAGEIAMAIENARLYQQTDESLRQKVQELETLQRVSNMVAATLDLGQVLQMIVEKAAELVRVDMSAIYELKEDSQYLTIVANHGLSEDYARHMRVRLSEGPVGRTAELNRPENVWDAHFELHPGENYYYNNQYTSCMCVPLSGARGVLGVICLYTRDKRHFNDEQLQIISAFADQAAIAIENARLYEEARRSLTIKAALLQEMHHRVRNNLQTVAALLSMQLRRTQTPEVVGPLSESVARIQSIAAIHDLLSREDVGVTTVNAVAKEITDIAVYSLVPNDKRIRFRIDDGKVPIASKEATLLAILIMELVSNAIFHGFEDRNDGEIRITAFVNEGRTQIEVRDNGKGYPNDFNLETAKTGLGMQIVRTLVTKDLQGIFRVENINGWATATIIFNSVYSQEAESGADDEMVAY